MAVPEVALERLLQEKHSRREIRFAHILGRVAVEDLPSDHLHRWLVEFMNRQLSDIGPNSTGGRELPQLHFDLVRTRQKVASADVFDGEGFGLIVVTQSMIEEMLALATKLVSGNKYFFNLQIAPNAKPQDIAHFLVLLQFGLVSSHEYYHVVRGHLDAEQPYEADLGDALPQAQELEADGYGLYHELTYFFHGGGRPLAARWLEVSNPKALNNSILDCFLLAVMLLFCARSAGKIRIESDFSAAHPSPPVRIWSALRFTEMWCREVGGMQTGWMTDEAFSPYFGMASNVISNEQKQSWSVEMRWLRAAESEEYRSRLWAAVQRIRTGH